MEHRELEELITPYLLGDTTPEQNEVLRRHLDDCERCRALARELESTLDLLRDALAAGSPAPARLDPERREAIYRSRTPGVLLWLGAHRRGLALAGAAAAITVVLGALLLPSLQHVGSMAAAERPNELARAPASAPQLEEQDLQRFGERFETKVTPPPASEDRSFDLRRGRPEEEKSDARKEGRGWEDQSQVEAHSSTDLKAVGRIDNDRDGNSALAFVVELPPAAPRNRIAGGFAVSTGQAGRGGNTTVVDAWGRTVEDLGANQEERQQGSDAGAVNGYYAYDLAKTPGLVSVPKQVESTTMTVDELAVATSGPVAGKDRNVALNSLGGRLDQSESDLYAGVKVSSGEPVSSETASRRAQPVRALSQLKRKESEMLVADGTPPDNAPAARADKPQAAAGVPEDRELAMNWRMAVGDEMAPVFRGFDVNPYVAAADKPVSTFGIDVDTASYTLARRYLLSGSRPPPEAVRTEEFVNFFDYDYRPPQARTFAVDAVGAPAPFGEGILLKIGVKGKRLGRDDQKTALLTFVVDTSGSMDTPERLGLVKTSLGLLLGELDPADRVAVVQVDSEARLVLEPTLAAQADTIRAVIDGLQCSGSTHLDAGIELGYQVATRGFVGGAVNRVLILSDGAANLGSASPEEILARVEASRKQGILCSVFGFGLGTYNDVMLETLANKGDGVYRFIDSEEEARRVFVDDLSAALQVIARDVKIQVEFDPDRVAQYRQLGYENRQLQAEDFRNDAIDAGEVGSGQSVTALYELTLANQTDEPLGTVRIRYLDETTGSVEEIAREIRTRDLRASAEEAGPRFMLAAGAAEFAELLRNSPFAADGGYNTLADALRPIALDLHLDQRVSELLDLVRRAGSLPAP